VIRLGVKSDEIKGAWGGSPSVSEKEEQGFQIPVSTTQTMPSPIKGLRALRDGLNRDT
jgi:hypothetical protein